MITPLTDSPIVIEKKFTDILKVALTKPTLQEALTYACICESERAINQARFNFGSGSNGAGWDTCFAYVIKETMEAFMKEKQQVIISLNTDLT